MILIIDQVIKFVVENNLVNQIELIPNFFYLAKVYNKGAAFSIFTGMVPMLIIINILILMLLLKYMDNFKNNYRKLLGFGFVIGGLFGNLIDRIVHGHVIDYVKLVFGSYNYPVFNIADMAVVIGVILLSIAVLKKEDVNENNS